MDTPSDSTSSLDVNQAAAGFADYFAQPEKEAESTPAVDTEIETAASETPDEQQSEAVDEAHADEAPEMVTVEINGKTVEVPLSEVKASYQKDKAASEKFEAAAALKKEASAETAKAQQERATYAANLERMGLQLEAVLHSQAQTDWNALLESDPVEFLKQKNLAEQRQAQLQQVNQQRHQIALQQQAEAQESYRAFLQEQQQQLLNKLPSWKDDAKAKAEQAALKTYLQKEGYDPQAIDGISDHKAVVLARKAMLYDQMIAKASAATKKVAPLPAKVERPGVAESGGLDRRGALVQKAFKSGSVEDMGKVFSTMFS